MSLPMITPAWARILPFAAYMAFVAGVSGLSSLAEVLPDWMAVVPAVELWHYPVKVLVVGILLAMFWSRYDELKDHVLQPITDFGLACVVGVLVYLAWVRMDWSWATIGSGTGYNPVTAGKAGALLAAVRLFGASVVVPLMEELFWRSFLLRYLISPQFETVAIGVFTPMSCLVTVVLFGLEHYLWFAGMVAGLAYTVLCYYTRRLWPAV